MLPKKRITAVFVIIAVIAVVSFGMYSRKGSRLAAPAAYIKNEHNDFRNDLFTNYNKINLEFASDSSKIPFPSSATSSVKSPVAARKNSSKAPASKALASKVAASKSKTSSNDNSASTDSSSAATAYFPLTAAEREKIERVVMSSCGELGDKLMAKANAQVILDRVKSGRFGKGINAVLDAPHQFERPWKGSINTLVKNAVTAVFDRGERVTKVRIYYYENPNFKEISTAVWCRGKRYITTIGHGVYIHEYWTDSD